MVSGETHVANALLILAVEATAPASSSLLSRRRVRVTMAEGAVVAALALAMIAPREARTPHPRSITTELPTSAGLIQR